SLKYYGYLYAEVPLYIIVFGAFLIGVFVAALLGAIDKLRMTLRMNKLYRKIDELEQKNLSLLRGASHQPPPPQATGMM
ncbi:MAG TPA: LapA family protein, partial [Syntrophales bacterium]|nr:LapA family protein [Syntrophales bacterium]